MLENAILLIVNIISEFEWTHCFYSLAWELMYHQSRTKESRKRNYHEHFLLYRIV